MPRPPLRPAFVAAVAVGGAVGASARWGIGAAIPTEAGSFPWATFGVNIVGSLLLALLPMSALVRSRPLLPPLLGTGVLGGFTTLSAYSEEARALAAGGHLALAASYVAGTVVACLAAVALASRMTQPAERAAFEIEEGDL